MVLEARSPRETLAALWTVEPLPRVDFLVFPQAARLVEAPVALRAVVGPFPSVREPVSVHGTRVGEALPTVWTGEWLFSCMDFLVACQLAFLGELFPTHGALVRFLS